MIYEIRMCHSGCSLNNLSVASQLPLSFAWTQASLSRPNPTVSPVAAGIDKLASISWSFLSRLTHNLSKLSEQSNIMAFYLDQLASSGRQGHKTGGAYKRSTVALNHLKILNEG